MDTLAIRKLRTNFILIAMLSFIAVMVFTGGLINITNNLEIRRNMSRTLDYIIENEGDLPEPEESSESELSSDESDTFLQLSPELRYSTRYFAVLYDAGGQVIP